MNKRFRFALNFDLHTDKNSEAELNDYVGISLSKMYNIIREYLTSNNFEWIQGSGYITKNPISSRKLTNIITNLYDNNQWLGHFTKDIKTTKVDELTYSYDSILKYYDNKFYNKYMENDSKNEMSVKDLKERFKTSTKQATNETTKTIKTIKNFRF